MNKTGYAILSKKDLLVYIMNSFLTNDQNMTGNQKAKSLKYIQMRSTIENIDENIKNGIGELLEPYFDTIDVEITGVGENIVDKKIYVTVTNGDVKLNYENNLDVDELEKYIEG